jgi:glycosyltransferase involved in cell wall biosynthesis
MRILFLDHTDQLGGAEISLLELLRTLDRRRFAPTLACPPGHLADRARTLDVPVIEVHLEKLKSWNPLATLARLRRGRRRVRDVLAGGDFAIVHPNTLRAAIYAAGVRDARLLWHVRDYAMPAWARRMLLRRCDRAVATSAFLADSLGASPKVCVVPNGIELAEVPDEAAFGAFRQEFAIPPEAPVVGCLGRVRPWKGQARFVDVVARLAPRLPEARFLLVGGTLFPDPGRDYVAELKQQADDLGVADRIIFTGHRDDPLAALGAMDVVVNCSLDEPFGRVLIEAMACRRPVVAFRSGAVPEIVADGDTGVLVAPGDTAGMAEAILGLVSDRARAEAFGEAGRRRVAAHFTLDASTRGIEALSDERADL